MSKEETVAETAVMIFKLASGEEIIGKVSTHDVSTYKVEKPFVVQLRQDNKGDVSVQFIPFMSLAFNEEVLVMVNHIAALAPPNEQTEENYLRIIGDKVIAVAPKQIILG